MASTWPQGLGSAQSRTQMPIFVHTLETREGPLFLSFPSMKLAAYLQSMRGPHKCQHSLHLTPSPPSSSQDSHLPGG